MNRTRVFIASRFEEFRDLRRLLTERAIEDPDIEIVNLDDGRPSDDSPSERSLSELQRSDVVVFLLGRTYGNGNRGGGYRSITEQEFEHALRLKRSGANLRMRVWCSPDEDSFDEDARSFLRVVQQNVVVGRLDDDHELSADSILSNARAELEILSDEFSTVDAAGFLQGELRRLGHRVKNEFPTDGSPLSNLRQLRSLGMVALESRNLDEALRQFRSARGIIGVDAVTNLIVVLLLQRTMVPSNLHEALEILGGMKDQRPVAIAEKDLAAWSEAKFGILVDALQARIMRDLGMVTSTYGALATRNHLQFQRRLDETSRPLLIEIAAYSALAEDAEGALESFRDLWFIYPSAALSLLYSPDFRSVRKMVERTLCDELRERVHVAGFEVGQHSNLRRLRSDVIALAGDCLEKLGELPRADRESVENLFPLAKGLGIDPLQVFQRGFRGLDTIRTGRESSIENLERLLVEIDQSAPTVVTKALALGWVCDSNDPWRELVTIRDRWKRDDVRVVLPSHPDPRSTLKSSPDPVEWTYSATVRDTEAEIARCRSVSEGTKIQLDVAQADLGGRIGREPTGAELCNAIDVASSVLERGILPEGPQLVSEDLAHVARRTMRGWTIGLLVLLWSPFWDLVSELPDVRMYVRYNKLEILFFVAVLCIAVRPLAMSRSRLKFANELDESVTLAALLTLGKGDWVDLRNGKEKWSTVNDRLKKSIARNQSILQLRTEVADADREMARLTENLRLIVGDQRDLDRARLAGSAEWLLDAREIARRELVEQTRAHEETRGKFTGLDFSHLQELVELYRKFNKAFRKGPSIAFPAYVPFERASPGNLTVDRETDRIARVVAIRDRGDSLVCLSAVSQSNPSEWDYVSGHMSRIELILRESVKRV